MSVLKPNSGEARTVRPFRIGAGTSDAPATPPAAPGASGAASAAPATQAPARQSAQAKAADERLALSRRIAELEQSVAENEKKAEAAVAEAREAGREEGRAEAEKQDAERLTVLTDAAEKAHANAVKALETQRSLAVDIARATLGQILGERSAFSALVSETAALWKAKLADTMVVRLRVSEEDFANHFALEQLQASVGNLDISVEQELPPGSCIFDLQLGEVDASIPLQAQRADDVLSDYAQAGPHTGVAAE